MLVERVKVGTLNLGDRFSMPDDPMQNVFEVVKIEPYMDNLINLALKIKSEVKKTKLNLEKNHFLINVKTRHVSFLKNDRWVFVEKKKPELHLLDDLPLQTKVKIDVGGDKVVVGTIVKKAEDLKMFTTLLLDDETVRKVCKTWLAEIIKGDETNV